MKSELMHSQARC